ncbi:MAG: ABC transporter permease [Fulvivirga sp.]|nr:ABC transporter permease [Fulvivirga sp.]
MIRNYLKIAIRNLMKNSIYSIINITGLAIGITSCMMIGIYVANELSYDKFHENAEKIYRVNTTFKSGDASKMAYMSPTALLPNVLREIPEVETGVRILNVGAFSPVVVSRDNDLYQETRFLYVDSTFFEVFPAFNLMTGDEDKALTEPNSLVLTASAARKYFNSTDVLGEVLKVNDTEEYKITGVAYDVPANSHFHFDFLASFTSLNASKNEIWGSANYSTYLKLIKNDPQVVKSKIDAIVQKALGETFATSNFSMEFTLLPLLDIHLKSPIAEEMEPQSSLAYIYIFGSIGIIILLIACINYMNLATARSVERAREVGMRKVLGANKHELFYQFMGESFIITCLAGLFSLVLFSLLLGPFNSLSGKAFGLVDIMNAPFFIAFLGLILLVSFISGAYPALKLTYYKPNEVLKSSFKRVGGGAFLRKALVVVQFCVSVMLVIGTFVVYEQLNFMRNKALGYNKENVLEIPTDSKVNKDYWRIRDILKNLPAVKQVSIASESPVNIGGGYTVWVEGMEQGVTIGVNAVTTDQNFVEAMNMQIIEGSNFSEADEQQIINTPRSDREHHFLVNEQFLKRIMVDQNDVIGKRLVLNGRQGTIKGVVKDFHFSSLHNKINPLVLMIEPEQYNLMFVRISGENVDATMDALKKTWAEMVPHRPFDYSFMDAQYDAMYRNEQKLADIFVVFSAMAIVIGCLGLFGLVSFAAYQRSKEISIRKVFGATVSGIVAMLARDFGKWIVVAFLIGTPIAYWLIDQWLADFEYRIEVGALPILLAIGVITIIASITISYQAIKAALVNPADTLRSE